MASQHLEVGEEDSVDALQAIYDGERRSLTA